MGGKEGKTSVCLFVCLFVYGHNEFGMHGHHLAQRNGITTMYFFVLIYLLINF